MAPRYPISRSVHSHIRAADLARDLERVFQALESGIGQTFPSVDILRKNNTEGYVEIALHVLITGVGIYQWSPTSVLPDDGVTAIRPIIGPAATGPGRWIPYTGGGGGGAGTFPVYDNGVLVQAASGGLNFRGPGVLAANGALPGSVVDVFVPAPTYLSHWNTADGTNGAQVVSETATRTLSHISTPSGGEGTPFRTGGWAGTNQSASRDNIVTFTTPASTTGFGGDSTITVTVYDADGVTSLETFTTLAVIADGVYPAPSGRITVTITGFGPDSIHWQAKASVAVSVLAILTSAGRSGGRYHVKVQHTTDSVSDGSGPWVYTQTDLFLDTNPSTPSLAGVSLAETGGSIVTKHLSGVEFYALGSQFTLDIATIDGLNANSSRVVGNVEISGPEYGLPPLSQSPFGVGAANFTGWTNANNNAGASYHKTDWAISAASYRLMSPTSTIDSYPRDTWNSGALVVSGVANVLIDTYVSTATALAEYFDDESRREDPVTFPGIGTWNSTATLVAGQAQIWNGQLSAPNVTTYVRPDGAATPNANWTGFKPDTGGANPDYSALGVPVTFGRRFTQAPANIPSFSLTFAGTFAASTALADLVAGNLEIYVYRVGGFGHIGPPSVNAFPLRVHLGYSFASWNDGLTIAGSGIREGSSAGNTINCTFGAGTAANGGFYCVIRILNAGTRIDSMVVTFF